MSLIPAVSGSTSPALHAEAHPLSDSDSHLVCGHWFLMLYFLTGVCVGSNELKCMESSAEGLDHCRLSRHKFLSLNGHQARMGIGKIPGRYEASALMQRCNLAAPGKLESGALGPRRAPHETRMNVQAEHWVDGKGWG